MAFMIMNSSMTLAHIGKGKFGTKKAISYKTVKKAKSIICRDTCLFFSYAFPYTPTSGIFYRAAIGVRSPTPYDNCVLVDENTMTIVNTVEELHAEKIAELQNRYSECVSRGEVTNPEKEAPVITYKYMYYAVSVGTIANFVLVLPNDSSITF